MNRKDKSESLGIQINQMKTDSDKPMIVVAGSVNMDYCVLVQRLPQRGESLIGGDMRTFYGGKGANQAIAAARLGGHVGLLAKTGNDASGLTYREHLRDEGIDTSSVFTTDECPTGSALILVEELGQSFVVVSPSANMRLDLSDLRNAEQMIASAGTLLLQMEIPLEVIEGAIRLANRNHVKVILNPSPVNTRFHFNGFGIDYLVLNDLEVEALTGVICRDLESLIQAAEILVSWGVKCVVVTRGQESTLVDYQDNIVFVPTIHVDSVDTVGAGDTFAGAFAVALGEGMDIVSAVRFANCAGALATTRLGAQASMPFRAEVEDCLITNLERIENSMDRQISLAR